MKLFCSPHEWVTVVNRWRGSEVGRICNHCHKLELEVVELNRSDEVLKRFSRPQMYESANDRLHYNRYLFIMKGEK